MLNLVVNLFKQNRCFSIVIIKASRILFLHKTIWIYEKYTFHKVIVSHKIILNDKLAKAFFLFVFYYDLK